MSINRSEQFYYFQNKAHHYQNLKNIKPVVNDKLSNSFKTLINHSTSPRRKRQNHLQKYQINQQNQALMNRLYNIMNSKKSQVSATGSYSRSNYNERNFRKFNPHRDEQSRLIDLQNQKITQKINHTRAVVGSIDRWKSDYYSYLTHRQNLSRYDKEDELKGPLEISVEKFVPKSYRTILNTQEIQQHQKRKKITLNNSKLLQLPPINSSMSKQKQQKTSKQQFSNTNVIKNK